MLAMRQIMHAPQRPLQLIVRSSGASCCGFMSAVATPLSIPYQIDIMMRPAMGAAAENVALRCANEQRNSDLAPVIGDELKNIRIDGAFARCFDGDFRWTPIRKQPNAVIIAILQTGLVEQGIGLFRIMIDPCIGIFRLEQGAFGQNGIGAGLSQAVEHRHIDFVPVDGKRQARAARAHHETAHARRHPRN